MCGKYAANPIICGSSEVIQVFVVIKIIQLGYAGWSRLIAFSA